MEKKSLSRNEIAIIKRTAKNTRSLRIKREKLLGIITKTQEELDTINQMINEFEAPIIKMTGGYSSEQVLNGDMDVPTGEQPELEENTGHTEVSLGEEEVLA